MSTPESSLTARHAAAFNSVASFFKLLGVNYALEQRLGNYQSSPDETSEEIRDTAVAFLENWADFSRLEGIFEPETVLYWNTVLSSEDGDVSVSDIFRMAVDAIPIYLYNWAEVVRDPNQWVARNISNSKKDRFARVQTFFYPGNPSDCKIDEAITHNPNLKVTPEDAIYFHTTSFGYACDILTNGINLTKVQERKDFNIENYGFYLNPDFQDAVRWYHHPATQSKTARIAIVGYILNQEEQNHLKRFEFPNYHQWSQFVKACRGGDDNLYIQLFPVYADAVYGPQLANPNFLKEGLKQRQGKNQLMLCSSRSRVMFNNCRRFLVCLPEEWVSDQYCTRFPHLFNRWNISRKSNDNRDMPENTSSSSLSLSASSSTHLRTTRDDETN